MCIHVCMCVCKGYEGLVSDGVSLDNVTGFAFVRHPVLRFISGYGTVLHRMMRNINGRYPTSIHRHTILAYNMSLKNDVSVCANFWYGESVLVVAYCCLSKVGGSLKLRTVF